MTDLERVRLLAIAAEVSTRLIVPLSAVLELSVADLLDWWMLLRVRHLAA